MLANKFLNDVFDENGSVFAESPGGNILIMKPTDSYPQAFETLLQFTNVVDRKYDTEKNSLEITFDVDGTIFRKEFERRKGRYIFTNGSLSYS